MMKKKMTNNELLLEDRIQKIQQVISQYGEENFYISFSGGKDSTVLSVLIDLAIPNNKIPRVYANTGIELDMIKNFVFEMQKTDNRIVVIKPSIPIKPMLESEGYPFKSKHHSHLVEIYQRRGKLYGILNYIGEGERKDLYRPCPKKLKYQFTDENKLKISDKCCVMLKEKPLANWAKENNKPYIISGIMADEGGRRTKSHCLAFRSNKLFAFQPLITITKKWEDWFISEYNVKICDIYKEPYNFIRTGCKGCPFAINIQKELDTLEKFFPNEKKQCEAIWKPVYDEYRRLHYRLK